MVGADHLQKLGIRHATTQCLGKEILIKLSVRFLITAPKPSLGQGDIF